MRTGIFGWLRRLCRPSPADTPTDDSLGHSPTAEPLHASQVQSAADQVEIHESRDPGDVTFETAQSATCAVPSADRLAALRDRDVHSLREDEFEELLALERAEDRQWEPTTQSLPKSRVLSKTQEASAITLDAQDRPSLRLVPIAGQLTLMTPSGKIVDPKSSSIYRYDLFVVRVRGTAHYQEANLLADTTAGTTLTLKREPDNEHDANAVAVTAADGKRPLGYVNKLNARRLAKRLDAGAEFAAMSLRGSPPGGLGDPLTVLVTRVDLLKYIQRPGSPPPAADPVDPPGKWVISDRDVFAEVRWRAGTPPMHGLAKGAEKSPLVARVEIDQELSVVRTGRAWFAFDEEGRELGQLRWKPGDQGRVYAQTQIELRYPDSGTLHVTKVYIEGDQVLDFGGYVAPNSTTE